MQSYVQLSLAASSALFLFLLTLGAVSAAIDNKTGKAAPTKRPPRLLSLPVADKCSKRPKEFFFKGHWYFYSGNLTQYRDYKGDWLDGRNICREYCMDLLSLETPDEDRMIRALIQKNDVPYIWTSGRLCNFKGCERQDLQPATVNGWFWSGSSTKMAPTNQIPPGWGYQPWSHSGHLKKPQPDNAEFAINGSEEACMSVLNNVYGDGIQWHDVACYHPKPFYCEDSQELLDYISATNKDIRL